MERHDIPGPMEGVTFVVEESGPADGPCVVWLHDAWGQLDDPPIDVDGARVLTLHHPGWGVADGVERFLTLTDLAIGYWWLLDRLDADDIVLAGHGIGATIAIEMAAQQPQRVRAVVGATPFGLVDDRDPGEDFFALLPPHLLPHLYVDPTGDLVTRHFPPPADAYEKGLAAIRRVQVLGSASRYLFPLPDTGIDARLYRLADLPVDLLFGAKDGVVPEASRRLWEQAMPSATIEMVDDAAHMLPYESDAFARRVAERVAVPASA